MCPTLYVIYILGGHKMSNTLKQQIEFQKSRLKELNEMLNRSFKDDSFSNLMVIDWMLEYDKGSYYLPNLYNIVISNPIRFYELFEIAKPKKFDDLVDLIQIHFLEAYDNSLLIKHVSECGVEVISRPEQVLSLLLEDFVDADEANLIVEDLSNYGYENLREWEQLIIDSLGISSYQLSQIRNIKGMISLDKAEEIVDIMYQLSCCKFYYPKAFNGTFIKDYSNSFVGPFFYINTKLYFHQKKVMDFDYNLRFFDDETTHFEFFDTLGIDGDYGNYPRGRVIYDNFYKKFIIYMDESLNKIKPLILSTYQLDKERTVFRKDITYTHDGL